MDKNELMKKWAPIIDSLGVTGSKANWLAQYAQCHQDVESLLPIAMRVASKTIGHDLVTVQPLESINHQEMDRIKNEVKAENRERKIDALTENKEFEEMKVEDHPDYKISGPSGQLFYLDYQYGTGTSSI
jgi:hypothetical protein